MFVAFRASRDSMIACDSLSANTRRHHTVFSSEQNPHDECSKAGGLSLVGGIVLSFLPFGMKNAL